jgi:hypothetical protein
LLRLSGCNNSVFCIQEGVKQLRVKKNSTRGYTHLTVRCLGDNSIMMFMVHGRYKAQMINIFVSVHITKFCQCMMINFFGLKM